jgi:hypothetical protein
LADGGAELPRHRRSGCRAAWHDIDQKLGRGVSCPKLKSYWHFHGCRYEKASRTCAEPDHIAGCPLPSHDLRNGHLNQAAYSLFLFIRGLADGDLIGCIDAQLQAANSPPGPRLNRMAAALIEPMREIYGVSDKVLAMALSSLLLGAGDNHTIIIEGGTGQVRLCGWNLEGCLGIGETTTLNVMIPTKPVPNGAFTGTNIVATGGGFLNSYAVDNLGRVLAWVGNWFSQLGPGTSSILQDSTAREVSGLSDVVGLSAGAFYCLALKRDGTLWSWGSDSTGQLGQSVVAGPNQPPGPVVALDHVSAFSAGYLHSLTIAHSAS